jgi:hypothetical protein
MKYLSAFRDSKSYYLKKIPQIAHFIWGNKNGLPLTRYLSVASFAVHNPDFDIFVHTFDSNISEFEFPSGESFGTSGHTKCYWTELQSLNRVKVIKHSAVNHGFEENIPPMLFSDALRYYLLNDRGGWYFDTDILFFNPINHTYINCRLYENYTLLINATKRYAPPFDAVRIGVLAAERGSRFFHDAYSIAKKTKIGEDYQSIGAVLISKLLTVNPGRKYSEIYFDELIHNISDRLFYLYEPHVLNNICNQNYTDLGWGVYQCGVHWYGGVYSKDLVKKLDNFNVTFPSLTTVSAALSGNTLLDKAFLHSYKELFDFFKSNN